MRLKVLKHTVVALLILLLAVLPAYAQDPLTQTFTSSDGTLTFMYPESWGAGTESSNFYAFASNDTALADAIAGGADIPSVVNPGQVILIIFMPSAVSFLDVDLSAGIDSAISDLTTDLDEGATAGEPQSLTLADHDARTVSISSESEGDGLIALIDFDGTPLVAVALASPGEFSQYEPTILSILDSAQVTAPEPGSLSTYTSDDGSLTMAYLSSGFPPFGFQGSYETTNSADTFSDTYGPGTLSVHVMTPAHWTDSFDLPSSASPLEIILAAANAAGGAFADPPPTITLGDLTETTVGSYPALRLDYTVEGASEGFVLAMDVNGSTIVVDYTTALGERAQQELLALEIAASVTYSPTLVAVDGDAQGALTIDGEVRGTVGDSFSHNWTLDATAGELFWIQIGENEDTHFLRAYDSEGAPAIHDFAQSDELYLLASETGSYTINISSFSEEDVEYSLTATRVTPTSLQVGGTAEGTLNGETPLFYTFEGTAGQIVSITNAGASTPTLKFLGPSGIPVDDQYFFSSGAVSTRLLPFSGTYLLVVNGFEGDSGAYTLALSEGASTPIAYGDSVEGNYPAEDTQYYSFTGAKGDSVTITATSDAFTPHLQLFLPTGGEMRVGNAFTERGEIVVTLPADGTYTIGVGTLYDFNSGAFTLTLSQG